MICHFLSFYLSVIVAILYGVITKVNKKENKMMYIILIITAYLLGSIPFGLILTKMAGKGDIRKIGSGATGGTNVMRAAGAKLALLTIVLDAAKAMLAVWIGVMMIGTGFGAIMGAVAIMGHIYPVWLKFQGGKGVASMMGVVLVINPIIFFAAAIQWLALAIGIGYSSLASLIVLIMLPIYGFVVSPLVGTAFIAISGMALWAHRTNIKRLLNGQEDKIKWKWKK